MVRMNENRKGKVKSIFIHGRQRGQNSPVHLSRNFATLGPFPRLQPPCLTGAGLVSDRTPSLDWFTLLTHWTRPLGLVSSSLSPSDRRLNFHQIGGLDGLLVRETREDLAGLSPKSPTSLTGLVVDRSGVCHSPGKVGPSSHYLVWDGPPLPSLVAVPALREGPLAGVTRWN